MTDIIYAPINTTPVVDVNKHPTTVKEWILLLDFILDKTQDGKDAKQKMLTLADVDSFDALGWGGGRWVRNATHLWKPGVTDTLVLSVRDVRKTHSIILLDKDVIVDSNTPASTVSDNRLSHPDNMSWVLMELYSAWLKGNLKL